MKTAAIICEFNPLHNGHKYLIEQAKLSNDAVVCIMSGSFVQRGDIAVFDKWTRTHQALLSGADLVVELPVCFSLNSAERFAYGSVNLADSMNVIDTLFFGSECGDANTLLNAANILLNEPQEVSAKIKKYMSEGMSHPVARTKAYSDILDSSVISEPNNILGIEYIKALISKNSPIILQTVKRNSVSHDDLTPSGNFASASAIRKLIEENKDIKELVPKNIVSLYKNPATLNGLDEILRYKILNMTANELSKINGVSEGLENRIKIACKECTSFDEISTFVKSKRYTHARIRRTLLSILVGIDKEIAKAPPSYLRVLGSNATGRKILSQVKKKSDLTIITKTADFKNFNDSLDYDIKATDIYNIIQGKKTGEDFYKSPIIV